MRMEVLTRPERRRRWSDEEKLRIIGEAQKHGVRYADVAQRHDITPPQLYQWRVALREGRLVDPGGDVDCAGAATAVDFVETPTVVMAAATPAPAPATTAVIEVALSGGRVLKAPSSLPAAELKRLIRETVTRADRLHAPLTAFAHKRPPGSGRHADPRARS